MPPAKQLKPKDKTPLKLNVRKYLHMDALLSTLHHGFSAVADPRRGQVDISLADALMSGLTMFSLKEPSLPAFEERQRNDGNLSAKNGRRMPHLPNCSMQ